jgi:hypothetical protein
MPAVAWQYDAAPAVARVFVMRLTFAKVIPMVGADTYLGGRGRMLGKVFDRITVADGEGEPFDIGELTTYLNDLLLLAPAMLLDLPVTWTPVDDRSFDVALTDAGRIVSGRVFLDEQDAPLDFSTTDRFADIDGTQVRAEWRTPVRGWTRHADGRPVPAWFGATWHLPDGPLPYIEGRVDPASLAFDVDPV